MKLKDIGEFGFIDRIQPETLTRPENVIKGIGDDCSVCRSAPDRVTLLTTDMLVEGVHFQLASIPPYKLGRKSIAVNLSDIAAMGGTPKEALVSIAVPDTVPVETLDAIYEGMKSMAREFDVNLVGGDTTASPLHLVINVALVGEAREEEVLYRSGAKGKDVVFLTGPVGASAAGLDCLLANRSFEGQDALLDAHFDPHPHVRAGRIIAGLGVAHSTDRRLRWPGRRSGPHLYRIEGGGDHRGRKDSHDPALPCLLRALQAGSDKACDPTWGKITSCSGRSRRGLQPSSAKALESARVRVLPDREDR